MNQTAASPTSPDVQTLPKLGLAALGVVFGDIGTSPLYAFREALHVVGHDRDEILGVLSLILWSLILVVTLKYVAILLRADNKGEGGTLSLLALAQGALPQAGWWVTILGVLGAALFLGDAAITPAISVLSAVEGLGLVNEAVADHTVVIALLVLAPLFILQAKGTTAIARFFGPIMLLWFGTLAAGGLWRLGQNPEVLEALNPIFAVSFLWGHGGLSLVVLGAVFLSVTGAEALYADMGHFGRRPIVAAWLCIAFPALVLNYFGQGALILMDDQSRGNPFFLLFPAPLVLPVIILAAMATVVASQAVISGAYSLTRQAIQLHLLPRMRIRHTSPAQEGQIYLPAINILLLAAVTWLTIAFGSSSALASAYGISVTGTMLVTTLLMVVVARHRWHWSWVRVTVVLLPFLVLESLFLAANLLKFADGGWLPVVLALVIVTIMISWRHGARLVVEQQQRQQIALSEILPKLDSPSIAVIPGTGVYLSTSVDLTPTALLHSLKHFHALHEQLIIVMVRTANVPHIAEDARAEVITVSPRLNCVILTFGYSDIPDIPKSLMSLRPGGRALRAMTTSFILSRRRLHLAAQGSMPRWQARLFLWCARNAAGPTDYFRIPAGRVVEVGTQVNI